MSQSENADDSLLFGTAARRQELYPDSSNYDATREASAPSAQPGAPVQGVPPDNSSGSGNANAVDYAPPPPVSPPSFVQAGVDHWATTNTGVRNINGSQPSDMGFGVFNEQYTGNAPPTPTSAMNGQRSATSMEWEHVQAEPVFHQMRIKLAKGRDPRLVQVSTMVVGCNISSKRVSLMFMAGLNIHHGHIHARQYRPPSQCGVNRYSLPSHYRMEVCHKCHHQVWPTTWQLLGLVDRM